MLFSAGMGIGLMFWGVAEPVMHYVSPPVGTVESIESAKILHNHSYLGMVAMILAKLHFFVVLNEFLTSCFSIFDNDDHS